MAGDSIKTLFSKFEGRYLKKAVGNALNECLAELIQVRPADPIEYMGFWLRHYADSRAYFRQKARFYEDLLIAKLERDRARKPLFDNYNEAVQNIIAPLIEMQRAEQLKLEAPSGQDLATVANEFVVELKDETEHTTLDLDAIAYERMRAVSMAVDPSGPDEDFDEAEDSTTTRSSQQSISSYGSDKHRGSRKSRENRPSRWKILKEKATKMRQKQSRLTIDAEDLSNSSSSSISTRSRISVAAAKSKKSMYSIPQALRQKKAYEDDNDFDDGSNSSPSPKTMHRILRSDSLEVIPGTWKVVNNQVLFAHPLLGSLTIEKESTYKRSDDYWLKEDFTYPLESMYDPELYCKSPVPGEVIPFEFLYQDVLEEPGRTDAATSGANILSRFLNFED